MQTQWRSQGHSFCLSARKCVVMTSLNLFFSSSEVGYPPPFARTPGYATLIMGEKYGFLGGDGCDHPSGSCHEDCGTTRGESSFHLLGEEGTPASSGTTCYHRSEYWWTLTHCSTSRSGWNDRSSYTTRRHGGAQHSHYYSMYHGLHRAC